MIDSHCHLADEAFENDLEAVVARANDAGLTGAIVILAAGDEAEAARAEKVRTAWSAVRFATGVHPHSAGTFAGAGGGRGVHVGGARRTLRRLRHRRDRARLPLRLRAARRAARGVRGAACDGKAAGWPVIIHTREATDETFELLAQAGGVRGVFHCFTGDAAMARRALDIGFHVSFSGIITFPKAEGIREAARLVPDDRLLAETDSPYLAPVPFRGKRNEPAHVVKVVEALATLRGAAPARVAELTSLNVSSLFGGC